MQAIRALALTSALFATASFVTQPAFATTRSAMAGRAASGQAVDENCFIYDNFAIGNTNIGLRNNCAGFKLWQMALDADLGNTAYQVVVRAREIGAGAVSCSVTTRDFNGAPLGTSSDVTVAVAGYQDLVMFPPVVPFGGTMLLVCSLSGPNTSKILSADWFPI
jgi:hypothetical protein